MSGDEQRLLKIAASISDGTPVDWERERADAADEILLQKLRQMRLIDDVAAVYRNADAASLAGTSPANMAATVRPESLRGSAAPAPIRWGHLEIREKLGQGGYGQVYRAWDANLDREVALKLLTPGIAAQDERARRVLKEGRMMARVRHPNVVEVYGAETHDDRVGLWMELVRGRTLSQLMQEQGKSGAREAALIGLDLCRALAAVHGAGLIHRDIKAQNVMREEGGRILLMDFGAGRDLDDFETHSDRGISGTPLYIAPEVYLGRPATERSDIYSLGVLLYHLVTGSFPVRGGSMQELRNKHKTKRARLLRDERSDLPEPFVQAIEKALARDPEQRFATAGRMDQALSAALGVEGGAPVSARPRRPWKAAAVAAGLLGVAVLGWIGLTVLRGPDPALPIANPPAETTASPSVYRVQATLYRQRAGKRERLDSGGSLEVGDELSLEVRASRELNVYVFNEDARGNAFALFPLPGFELQNPLPANATHELPGLRNGSWVRWQVDSAGGRERLIVLASPEPLIGFEAEMARLARPRSNAAALPVPEQARVRLRGIGSLVETDEPGPSGSAESLFEMARELAAGPEMVEGVWLREIELDNPGAP